MFYFDDGRGRGQGIVNILGDGFGSAIVARLSRKDLHQYEHQDEAKEDVEATLVLNPPSGAVAPETSC